MVVVAGKLAGKRKKENETEIYWTHRFLRWDLIVCVCVGSGLLVTIVSCAATCFASLKADSMDWWRDSAAYWQWGWYLWKLSCVVETETLLTFCAQPLVLATNSETLLWQRTIDTPVPFCVQINVS